MQYNSFSVCIWGNCV